MNSANTIVQPALRRLFSTMQWDMRLQFRNGFYFISAFMVAVLVILFWQLPDFEMGWLMPGLLLGNLIINTFYFIGGLVLLEKDEGSLEAQVVTPLRTWEYLSAKVGSLIVLSLLENTALVALIYGLNFKIVPLVLGIAITSALYALVGFIAVARYTSINEYLFPSMLYVMPLGLPLLDYFGLVEAGWLVYLHPIQAPLLILQAAFLPVAAWQWVYALGYSALWMGVFYFLGKRVFYRYIIGREGKSV
jgi:fluoroquinolone transport system permease protein